MKKLINVLLYSLLLVVVMAGMMGIRYFIVQEEERVELETEKRLEAERNAAMKDAADSGGQPENRYTVLVKRLPVYKNKKIVKIKADSGTEILSYGDKITVLKESSSYAQIQTETGTTGYVWSDCIGVLPDKDKPANAQPEVVVIDVKKPEQGQDTQQESFWQDAWVWSLKTAEKTEQKLEENGYTAVVVNRAEKDAVSAAKSAELANQIKADAVIHIYIGSSEYSADSENSTGGEGPADSKGSADSEGPADSEGSTDSEGPADSEGSTSSEAPSASENQPDSGAAVYCCTSDSSDPAAKYYTDSRKLGKYVLKYYTKTTGFDSAGIFESGGFPEIQRSKRPVILFQMGNLSNEEQSSKMSKARFQSKMARGITDGIDAYFRKQ